MSSPKKAPSQNTDFNALMKAIKRCLVEKKPIKSTAAAFAVPRSTLQGYLKKVTAAFDDIEDVDDDVLLDFVRECGQRVPSNQVFSIAQEKELVTYITQSAANNCGLGTNECRELAYRLALNWCIEIPDTWIVNQKAGMEWYRKFMRRHPELTLRAPERTPANSVKTYSKSKIQKFFDQLGALLDEYRFPEEVNPLRGVTIPKKTKRAVLTSTEKKQTRPVANAPTQKKRGRPALLDKSLFPEEVDPLSGETTPKKPKRTLMTTTKTKKAKQAKSLANALLDECGFPEEVDPLSGVTTPKKAKRAVLTSTKAVLKIKRNVKTKKAQPTKSLANAPTKKKRGRPSKSDIQKTKKKLNK